MLSTMKSISEIDLTRVEGRVLIAAIGRLSGQPGYTSKAPDEILQELIKIAEDFT